MVMVVVIVGEMATPHSGAALTTSGKYLLAALRNLNFQCKCCHLQRCFVEFNVSSCFCHFLPENLKILQFPAKFVITIAPIITDCNK